MTSPRRLSVLGVPVTDVTMDDALDLLEAMFSGDAARAHGVFFVNAHTLNTSCEDPAYLTVLNSADRVFGDGVGVRWAARILHGVRLLDNVNGTDLVPRLFQTRAGRGYRYFLLGNTPERIARAAEFTQRNFPGWTLAGCHHGYLDDASSAAVVAQINASNAQVLLVGMGNPKQETWIAKHLPQLRVPVCMGTGGLFDYWSGDLVRAPRWVRAIGCEWLHLMLRQPQKTRRYMVGNPRFLYRVFRSKLSGADAA